MQLREKQLLNVNTHRRHTGHVFLEILSQRRLVIGEEKQRPALVEPLFSK